MTSYSAWGDQGYQFKPPTLQLPGLTWGRPPGTWVNEGMQGLGGPGGSPSPLPNLGGEGDFWSKIGRFLTENPELVTGVLGAGADIYGSVQASKRAGQALKLQEQSLEQQKEAEKRRSEENRIAMILQAMQGYIHRPR